MLREYILEVRVKFVSSCRDHWKFSYFIFQIIQWKKANRNFFTMRNFSRASIWALKLVYLEIIGVNKSFGLLFYEYS
jgi:hypothetical protein